MVYWCLTKMPKNPFISITKLSSLINCTGKKYKHAEIETIFFSVTLHKLKCNWLKDDEIIPNTLKLIEEKDRLTIQDILHTGQNIFNRTFYRTTTFSISAENENNKW